MLEWLKRHAWKACVPQKGIASSNLALSANKRPCGRFFCVESEIRGFARELFIRGRFAPPTPPGLRCFDFFEISLTLRPAPDGAR